MAAAAQGRQVEAIRVAIEYAQSAAAGQDDQGAAASSDAEDFAAHLREDKAGAENLRKMRSETPHRHRRAASATVLRQHSVASARLRLN